MAFRKKTKKATKPAAKSSVNKKSPSAKSTKPVEEREHKPVRTRKGAAQPAQRKVTARKGRNVEDFSKMQVQVDEGQRLHMVAEAAYYISEKRGFHPGSELKNWLEAEAQINQMFSE